MYVFLRTPEKYCLALQSWKKTVEKCNTSNRTKARAALKFNTIEHGESLLKKCEWGSLFIFEVFSLIFATRRLLTSFLSPQTLSV